jgi:hypothetical protein
LLYGPPVPTFLKLVALVLRLHSTVPAMSWGEAIDHASAAVHASTDRVQPELLLAVAFVESRFDPTATSRVEGGTRRTGHYPWTAPPPNLVVRASLYCGPLQTFAASWSDCVALRQLHAGYAAGAAELEQWLRDRRVHGSITLALAGHGCGNWGLATGKCNEYPSRVLRVRRLFVVEPAVPRAAQARVTPRS